MTVAGQLLPLVQWDPVRLSLSLDHLERHLRRVVEDHDAVGNLRLEGRGDVVEIDCDLRTPVGMVRVRIGLCELRLKNGFLGGRIRRVRVLGGMRLPRRTLIAVLRRALGDRLTVFPGDGIVVFDLRRWLPSELRLTVIAVQVVGRILELWLGAGALARVPASEQPALGAGAGESEAAPTG